MDNPSQQRFSLPLFFAALLSALLLASVLPMHRALAQQQQQPRKGQVLEAPDVQYRFSTSRWGEAGARAGARPDVITTTLFEETFEDDVSDWTMGGAWGIGAPTSGPTSGFESDNAAGTNLEGEYPNNAADTLAGPFVSLPSVDPGDELFLRLREWFEIENCCDDGIVAISVDGEMIPLGERNGSTDAEWRDYEANLTEFAGQDVQLKFLFFSDGSVTPDGWYIDNVRVVKEEPAPLPTSITSLDARSFPDVYMNVSVGREVEDAPLLSESNFEVYEDGMLQEGCFDVVPPDATGGVRLADIIFVIDDTGSMGGEIDQVRDNVISFVDQLEASGVNFALGLTTYKDDVTLYNEGTLTEDASAFRSQISDLFASGGGDFAENGLAATEVSLNSFSFRPGSQKIFVLITDATSQTPPDHGSHVTPDPPALDALIGDLRGAGVTTYVAGPEHPQYTGVGSLSEETGGRFFPVTAPFDSILDDISSAVSDSYVVSYCAENDSLDGTTRTVRVEVNADGESNFAERTYVAGGEPRITRTDTTKALEEAAQPDDAAVTIEARITDAAEPFVERAQLFYKNTTASSTEYNSVDMTTDGDDIYRATIPASAVANPGMDYYIRATDGARTTTSPSSDPAIRPHQFAVLPNELPSTDFTPPAAEEGEVTTITVTVTDDSSVESVTLYFRPDGDLLYTSVSFTPASASGAAATASTSGARSAYTADIPPSALDESGSVEYYIGATDDTGTTRYIGTRDEPNVLASAPSAPSGLAVAETSAGAFQLDFSASTSETVTEYLVYRSPAPEGTEGPVEILDSDATSYTDESIETGTRYYYRISARNRAGLESGFTETASGFIAPAEVGYEVTQGFGDASQSSNYRLIGLPGNENVALTDVLDGTFGTDWKAYRQNDSGDALVEAPDAEFASGKGLWVISKNNLDASNSAAEAVEIAEDGTATLALKPGWNIISNPTEKPLDWSTVQNASGGATQPLWSFASGSYEQASTFAPAGTEGRAFYFFNEAGMDELVLPYAPEDAPSWGSTPEAETPSDTAPWTLALTASRSVLSAGASDAPETFHATARVGVADDANAGFDARDAYAPPGRFEAVSLRLLPAAGATEAADELEEGFAEGTELAAEYRPPTSAEGQRFELALRAGTNQAVTLRADMMHQQRRSRSDAGRQELATGQVVLLRPATGERFDLSERSEFQLTPGAEEEHLVLLVGSEAFVEAEASETTPDESKLLGSYPNPFRKQATVAYTVAEPSTRVELTVYDALGRKVRTLVDGEEGVGRKEAVLRAGSLASGVYLFRLRIGDHLETGRLVLVR